MILDGSGVRIAHSFSAEELFRPAGRLLAEVVEEAVAWNRFGPATRQLLTTPSFMSEEFRRATGPAASLSGTFRGYAPANGR